MKRAFTLLEMVVVIALIALMTHLAVRELDRLVDHKKDAAADAQLESIKAAVYHETAGAEPGGFLADMGRLPRLAEPDGRASGVVTNGTLAELWLLPEGADEYRLKEAVGSNLCAGVSAKAGVWVPTGWRGPYVKLPIGKSRLCDAWGNAFESDDYSGLERLSSTGGVITAVSHYGATARRENRREVSLIPDRGAESSLFVSIESAGSGAGTVEVAWYGPSSGLVTGAVESAAYPGQVRFTGLTPGRRVVFDSVTGASRFVDLKPGENTYILKLP